ncbi:MAG: hypothetical protein RL696_841 [Actinomycetota bacterium]
MIQKRSTWQKTAVREALEAQELYQQLLLQGQKIGLTTVYRALSDLAQQGEADALSSADSEIKYRSCTTEHHHHLICRRCGVAVEFELPGFEAAAEALAGKEGFTQVSHTIELYGICVNCGVSD